MAGLIEGLMVVREKTPEEKSEFREINSISDDFDPENIQKVFENVSRVEAACMAKGSANFKIIFRSKNQEHGFNFPFQIGTNGNNPQQAESSFVNVSPGDLVILGTDGLFDNLYAVNILEELEVLREEENLTPQVISRNLAKRAFDQSLRENYISPFSMSAILNVGVLYKGGKSDDITVSVGQIQG